MSSVNTFKTSELFILCPIELALVFIDFCIAGEELGVVKNFLAANNRNDGAGRINSGEESMIVTSGGRIQTMDDLKNRIVTIYQGNPVRLADVAEVSLSSMTRYGAVTDSGKGETVEALVVALKNV